MSHEDPLDIIARLWEAHREVVAARIVSIEAGIDAIRAGAGPSDDAVQDAYRAAHNLAGALGSYGRAEGSVLARDMMTSILEPGADPGTLRSLLTQIEAACS